MRKFSFFGKIKLEEAISIDNIRHEHKQKIVKLIWYVEGWQSLLTREELNS